MQLQMLKGLYILLYMVCSTYNKVHFVSTVVLVDDGAILDIVLENFNHPPPAGFEKIMVEQSLL